MEAGKNSVIYMGLVPGPNKADNICGKTKVTEMMQRGSTVLLNDWMAVNNDLEIMYKEVVMAEYEILSWNVPGKHEL
jgi:hypothetical protein